MLNRDQSGLTLVELLVAIVMFSIIVTGIYNVFRVHNLMAAKQEETTLMQQELLSTMVQISEDLRMCGYSPNGGTVFRFIGTESDGRGTNQTSVYCTKDTLIENGVVDDDDNATEHAGYRLNMQHNGAPLASPDNTLHRYVPYANATKWVLAATNISDLQFEYLDADGDIIPDPTTNANQIRTVQITATAIPSARRAGLGIGNRTMTTSVQCRNLGL
jgi:prepilin-type N-terminal cleavage/methylation domain-containing protein